MSTVTVGPGEVQAAARAAVSALSDVLAPSGVAGSRQEWAAAAGSLQEVINVAIAAQDAAIVRLAAIEPEWLEDGTEVESHRALGHLALDAPAILSGVLSTAALHAERRVRTAVLLAADGPPGTDTHTGLGGLHAAMAAGRLDAYRATVITDELEHAPAEVRASVVAALGVHFDDEDGTHLRRRCRRVLARISPDLLRQRAARARAESSLRRWVDEPGVDHWDGTFPSEEAAQAWAAIDALARQYVADGVCGTIDRARAKALTDLVAGNATITTVLTVTVPAEALTTATRASQGTSDRAAAVSGPAARDLPTAIGKGDLVEVTGQAAAAPEPAARGLPPAIGKGDLVEVTGPAAGQPVLVSREWLADTALTAPTQVAPCHPITGALLSDDALPHAGLHPRTGPPRSAVPPRNADRCSTKAEAVVTTGTENQHGHEGASADGDPGSGAEQPATSSTVAVSDVGGEPYRPSARMAKRIRARDRRCRFPGCTVAAVFCDLDHVRPWPAGRTADDNLMCLCRRHHRVKQRRGWRVTLGSDGVATWTDPTRRVRTTYPVDALHSTVLTAPPTRPGDPTPQVSTSRARTDIPDGAHTELEFRLEHLGATGPPLTSQLHQSPRGHSWRDDHGIRHVTELTPSIAVIVLHETTTSCRRPRRRGHHTFPDEPPF